ncbi:c-type cytochrome [Pseudodesulfovibrio piezophilus]|uniref:Cytochrome c domain-containing protein n=1 Tax=Pseudodesulfovibrio piezophilus (strain DSM 21447 / JCM 15486 / C1TLV30) TaxID=1322246 RepID=M1WQ93_PSEP2|nr:c-type cytochrome [Pseudodesulfovibrio piezophilus]CCH47572.1 conserved exported protein of unknown function [Pseudodesulfovibrio piezophilus C1TLV30]
MIIRYLCALVLLTSLLLPLTAYGNEKNIDKKKILAEATTANGESIFLHGKHSHGAHIPFDGGPYWLRNKGGGCAACHGVQGLGGIQPDFCFVVTPPISFKYLVEDGYPFASRQDGSHPAYTMRTLQEALYEGLRPNGYEMDYCMPRWKMSDNDFRDLLSYLIRLDIKE